MLEGVEIALDEGGAFEEIEGQIAADAKFGEHGQFSAASLGLVGEGEDARGIAFEIAYGGIKLRESYFHAG